MGLETIGKGEGIIGAAAAESYDQPRRLNEGITAGLGGRATTTAFESLATSNDPLASSPGTLIRRPDGATVPD